jgi:DNA-binding transcriptional LysR family regulator
MGRFKVNDMLSCKTAAVLGLGIALLPERLCQNEIEQGQLKVVMAEYSAPDANLFAVYPSRHWVPAKLRAFLDYLESWAQGL